jgi:bacteriorhodopsin
MDATPLIIKDELKTTKPATQEEKEATVSYYVRFSFTITYVLLLTTGTITFIEAMRTKDPMVRHIFNLETCISLIAGYFYSVFVAKLDHYEKASIPVDWKNIAVNRYIDWAITTPLMLLVLCVFISQHTKTIIHVPTYISIVILNWLMLYLGYYGESSGCNRLHACLAGFVPFFMMFGIIYWTFVKPFYSFEATSLFVFYLVLWGLYGVVYLLEESYKNIFYNVFDVISKCFVGLGLWLYYSRIIRL